MLKQNVYTVGIKRKFWWGYKKYKVLHHQTSTYISRDELKNVLNIRPRLFLYLADGTELCVSEIESRDWKLYPDYKKVKQSQEAKAKRAARKEVAQITAHHKEALSTEGSPMPEELLNLN